MQINKIYQLIKIIFVGTGVIQIIFEDKIVNISSRVIRKNML